MDFFMTINSDQEGGQHDAEHRVLLIGMVVKEKWYNDSGFSGGGRTATDLWLGHQAASHRCPPGRCMRLLGGLLTC
jgi:hypothetical protein